VRAEEALNVRRDIVALLAVIAVVVVVAVATVEVFRSSSASDVFDVQFTLKEVTDNSSLYYHRYGQYYDTWDIRITKLSKVVLRDVDVWTYNGGASSEIVRHYDYLGDSTIVVQALRVKNKTVTVDIYWEVGHEGFYCNPWE